MVRIGRFLSLGQLLQQNVTNLVPSSHEVSMSGEEDKYFSSLDEQVGVIVPFVQKGLRRMLAEVGSLFSPREAEAGGFQWIKPVIRPLAKKLRQRNLVKTLFGSYRRGAISRKEFIRMSKKMLHEDAALDLYGGSRIEPTTFPLPSKQTFQLENLKSLLKAEPKIRYKHLREKLPKLFPLLKTHGWQGEKLTLQQAEKYLGEKKSLFAGRWGKWEPIGGETWVEKEADNVLVVMPTKPSEALKSQELMVDLLVGGGGGHPPGYGWIRFKDVGDTRVVTEFQSDVEHDILDMLWWGKSFIKFDKGLVPPHPSSVKAGSFRTEAERTSALNQAEKLWNLYDAIWRIRGPWERDALVREVKMRIPILTEVFRENHGWKEDALSALVVDARKKKDLKRIFVPAQENLPRGHTEEKIIYDSYYKSTMKKVGGFKPEAFGGEDAWRKPLLTDPLVPEIGLQTGDITLKTSAPGLELVLDYPSTREIFSEAMREMTKRGETLTLPNLREAVKHMMHSAQRARPRVNILSAFEFDDLLIAFKSRIEDWKANTGFVRPLSLTLPLGLGLFTQND